jgi:hypothetical protein
MTRKNIGIALILVGVFGMIVLLTYGGPVLPHIVGPIVVTAIGLAAVFFKKKTA